MRYVYNYMCRIYLHVHYKHATHLLGIRCCRFIYILFFCLLQFYLRQWSLQLDVPIVSIDYSLAPEAPFPRALEECVMAYAWILLNMQQIGICTFAHVWQCVAVNHYTCMLYTCRYWCTCTCKCVFCSLSAGTTGERIVLVGDSSGGNFAFGVCMKLKELGLRMPDSILSIYPNVNASSSATPSRITALWDPILPLGVMLACQAVSINIVITCTCHQYQEMLIMKQTSHHWFHLWLILSLGIHWSAAHPRNTKNEKGESFKNL